MLAFIYIKFKANKQFLKKKDCLELRKYETVRSVVYYEIHST
jgi:hypothetical protein